MTNSSLMKIESHVIAEDRVSRVEAVLCDQRRRNSHSECTQYVHSM